MSALGVALGFIGCIGFSATLVFSVARFAFRDRDAPLWVIYAGLCAMTCFWSSNVLLDRAKAEEKARLAQYEVDMKARNCFVDGYTSERYSTYEIWQCPNGKEIGRVAR